MSAFEDWWKSNGGGTGQQFVDMQKGWNAAIKYMEAQNTTTNSAMVPFLLIEVFTDNGKHSHWKLIDRTNGALVWEQHQ